MDSKIKSNEDLGYNDFFEDNRKKLGLDKFLVARVAVEHKGAYKVKNTNGEFLARVTGKQMFDAVSREDFPAVGDWVAISELGEGQALIHGILPRKTIIKRKCINKNETQIIATNIDVAFVVESVGRDYNLNRFERYFAIACQGAVRPTILLNKIDLISNEELNLKLAQLKNRFPNVDIILTSTVSKQGIEELKNYIEKNKTYCFLGSSGVGKSSLINKLFGKSIIKTEEISQSTARGKHATTTREMYFLPARRGGGQDGGIVIDNPGMRQVGMTDAKEGIDSLFDEISIFAKNCKYIDCTHTHEPGCQVLEAVKLGKIDQEKYLNYVNLKKETQHYEMASIEKREKDRQFGKFVKKSKKQLKHYGHKSY
jgi:ribosome biogenesis GTPase